MTDECDTLREQLRLAELQIRTAHAVNEQRRLENEHLRRLLVAVLPPHAVYQEARELTRTLRHAAAAPAPEPPPT